MERVPELSNQERVIVDPICWKFDSVEPGVMNLMTVLATDVGAGWSVCYIYYEMLVFGHQLSSQLLPSLGG